MFRMKGVECRVYGVEFRDLICNVPRCPQPVELSLFSRFRIQLWIANPATPAFVLLWVWGVKVWVLGFGVWVLGFGCWGLGVGFWVLGLEVWVPELRLKVKGSGLRVWGVGLGCRVWGQGFRVRGLGLRVQRGATDCRFHTHPGIFCLLPALRAGIWGLGCGCWGLGSRDET